MVAPFPWTALPRVDRRASRVLGAVGARLRLGGTEVRAASGAIAVQTPVDVGITSVRVDGASVLEGAALHERLADPTAGVVRIAVAGVRGYLVAPGMLVRAIAQRVLGGPEELAAPRPLTVVERAVLVAAVAGVSAAVEVEPCQLGGPQVPGIMNDHAIVLDIWTDVGTVAIVLPIEVAWQPTRLALAALPRPAWLDSEAVTAAVVVGRARLSRPELASVKVRDVLIAGRVGRRGEADLAVARGAFRVALVPGTGRVTVLTSYERRTMDETLADDATLDVAIAVGDVRMSVRSLLELRPGQVLELGKPLGTGVELRLGAKVVARGELVDVDGEVGVRVLSLDRPAE